MTGMLLDPYLRDLPSEWEAVPPEILERLVPRSVTRVVSPDGVEHFFDTRGIITPVQEREIQRIARARWFLLRNDGGHGERLRCGRCGGRHAYFTLACIERPFHGLEEIVGLIRKIEGRDLVFDAVRLGTIEPITRKRALRLQARIRAKGEYL